MRRRVFSIEVRESADAVDLYTGQLVCFTEVHAWYAIAGCVGAVGNFPAATAVGELPSQV